jgi:hypothetical protein
MSALAACFVYLYPPSSFQDNAAIGCYRLSSEPESVADDTATKTAKPGKGSKKLASQHPSKSELLKIRELREEYGSAKSRTGDPDGKVSETVADDSARKESRPAAVRLGKIELERAERATVTTDDDVDETPTEVQFSSRISEFESSRPINGLAVSVSTWQIEQCAAILSTNEMVVGRERLTTHDIWAEGTVRRLALEKSKLV